jgi:putative aminopeptidase FrvX
MSYDADFLKALLAAPGPSSFESRPAKVWREEAERAGARLRTDAYGNSFATFGSGEPRVMLAGHIDEIGLIVSHVDDKGLLYFRTIGGWDSQQLVGQRVRVMGYRGDLVGVIGKKAIHLMDADDRKKVSKVEDLWIDIGAKDGDDARQHVRVGDACVLEQPFVELLNGRVASRAIDNRIGAYIALQAARRAHAAGATAELVAVATVQEEIGHMGALIAAYGLGPDLAIALDVTHATDLPGIDKKQHGDVPLGSGPSLNIGSVVHRGLFNALVETAEQGNIPYRIEVAPARTATDGDDTAKTRAGVPTAVVSIPNRYMHSANEMIDLEDLENVILLLERFLLTLTEASRFVQPD